MCTNGRIITVRKKGEEYSRLIRTNCGSCVECHGTRANSWAYRCYSHYLTANNAWFITLTLDDDHLTEAPDKRDIQLFIKRMRSYYKHHYGHKDNIKYFLVSEYGYETERLHYHAIFYDLPYTAGHRYIQIANEIKENIWHKGIVYVAPFDLTKVIYCLKYLHKDKELGNIRMSSSNLGNISEEQIKWMNTTTDFINLKVNLGYGKSVAMPRYFRKKYMTEDQKEHFVDYFSQLVEKNTKELKGVNRMYNFERRNNKFKGL